MLKKHLLPATIICCMMFLFISCDSDDYNTPVTLGKIPSDSIITTGKVTVIEDGDTRYHVISPKKGAASVTLVENALGIVIVDLGPPNMPNFGKDIKAYTNAINKPIALLITHAHNDHFGAIAQFKEAPLYAQTNVANQLKNNNTFKSEYTKAIISVATAETIFNNTYTFGTIAKAEYATGDNSYAYIQDKKTLFCGDLAYNNTHSYVRDYTPLTAPDELNNWINGLKTLKNKFGNYKCAFVGHGNPTAKPNQLFDENIAYLQTLQDLIFGKQALKKTGIGNAYKVRDVINELDALYPNYNEGALKLALPGAFGPNDPGAIWFKDPETVSTDNVFEISICKIKNTYTFQDYITARQPYISIMERQKGTLTDRELQPYFEFTNSGFDLSKTYISITSFEDLDAFNNIFLKTDTTTPEAVAFNNTFDFISCEVLQPEDDTLIVNLEDIAPKGSNKVWQVTVRDTTKYATFNKADYIQKRTAFVNVIKQQSGVVQNIQWKSLSNAQTLISMTIYENQQAATAIANDSALLNTPAVKDFLTQYPPNVFKVINTVNK